MTKKELFFAFLFAWILGVPLLYFIHFLSGYLIKILELFLPS